MHFRYNLYRKSITSFREILHHKSICDKSGRPIQIFSHTKNSSHFISTNVFRPRRSLLHPQRNVTTLPHQPASSPKAFYRCAGCCCVTCRRKKYVFQLDVQRQSLFYKLILPSQPHCNPSDLALTSPVESCGTICSTFCTILIHFCTEKHQNTIEREREDRTFLQFFLRTNNDTIGFSLASEKGKKTLVRRFGGRSNSAGR